MNEIDFVNRMAAHESAHKVEDYVAGGWHVWPPLKAIIWSKLVQHGRSDPVPATPPVAGKYLALLRTLFDRCSTLCRWSRRDTGAPNGDYPVDVIFLTVPVDRVMMEGAWYEIYTDPFVDMLPGLGFSSQVWEYGEARQPQHSASVKIQRSMDAESIHLAQKLDEPGWFADYRSLSNEILGREIAWEEIAGQIESVTARAKVFERWLRKTGAKALFHVCWYDPNCMAATMAAKQCGIRSVEIQHSLMGQSFAYTSWLRLPADGYEVLPDIIWCWGKNSVDELRANNPGFAGKLVAIAGGNLWLNRWRESKSRAPAADGLRGAQKKILVSLQLAVNPLLLDVISASPGPWLWILRFHPTRGEEQRDADRAQLVATGHPGLEFERANNGLLYDLLNDCDAHVTEGSGCALQALAFGVKSVILGGSDMGEAGKLHYRQFIEKRLMLPADTVDDALDAIDSCAVMNLASEEISDLFANDGAAKTALTRLLNNALPEEARL